MLKTTKERRNQLERTLNEKSYAHFKLLVLRGGVGEGGVRSGQVESEGGGWWKEVQEGGEWECS